MECPRADDDLSGGPRCDQPVAQFVDNAGGLASLPEGFTIQPIEVSKIVLQLDKEKKYNNSGVAVMRDILKTRGWSGLFVGYFGIQYRQTSWTAAYFGTLQFFSEQSKQVSSTRSCD